RVRRRARLGGCVACGWGCVARVRQGGVHGGPVRDHRRSRGDRLADQRADRLRLDVGRHAEDELATPREHPEHRRLLLLERPPARGPLQPPAAARSPFLAAAAGWPLCPATTYTSSHSTSPLSVPSGLRWTIPSR